MSPEDLSAYAEDAPDGRGDNILAELARKADEYLEASKAVAEAEAALEAARQRFRVISEQELPEIMERAGQDNCRTSQGYQVAIKKVIRASIPIARQHEAFQWLEQHGHASVIKNIVSAEFGRGEGEAADSAVKTLLELGVHPNQKRSVHPQTLAALVKELLATGVEIPLETFGVLEQKVATVK